jgi:hypothetical protein
MLHFQTELVHKVPFHFVIVQASTVRESFLLRYTLLFLFIQPYITVKRQDRAVGIGTGYGLEDQGFGVRVGVGTKILTSLCPPDRLWGPPNILSN